MQSPSQTNGRRERKWCGDVDNPGRNEERAREVRVIEQKTGRNISIASLAGSEMRSHLFQLIEDGGQRTLTL